MQKRYEELDSLRGLAALTVMALHMYGILQTNSKMELLVKHGPLRLFVSGGEAVILFFVLSGFVLSLPFYSSKNHNYLSFLIKRICRIYIPYLFAIALAIFCRESFYQGQIVGLSDYFNSFWNSSINASLIKRHLLLIDTFLSNLDPVVWSLVHEMRISIVFPLLMVAVIRLNWIVSLGLCIVFSLISEALYSLQSLKELTGTELTATINYLGMFIIGALLAKHKAFIQEIFFKLAVKFRIMLFIFGILMYSYLHPSFAIKIYMFKNIDPFCRTIMDSWSVTIGACILMITAISSSTFSKMLKNTVISYLGKISYSLYLIHIVIFYACFHALHKALSVWIIFLIGLAISLIISSLMYLFIEKNSISLGKMLANKLAGSKPEPRANVEQNTETTIINV